MIVPKVVGVRLMKRGLREVRRRGGEGSALFALGPHHGWRSLIVVEPAWHECAEAWHERAEVRYDAQDWGVV